MTLLLAGIPGVSIYMGDIVVTVHHRQRTILVAAGVSSALRERGQTQN